MKGPTILILLLAVVFLLVAAVPAGASNWDKPYPTGMKQRSESKAICWIFTPWPWRGACGVADSDRDGVPDDVDRCPDTPAGLKVDAFGCPLDADKDGVPDGIDKCPNTPMGATVDAAGCPMDTDKDGVYDGIDKCPNSPAGAKVDATGCCLDADKDGVPDGIDVCPDTPMGAKVDAKGCPSDSDKDGVYDGIDKCPDTPAGTKVDASGCPVTEMAKQLLDTGVISTSKILFDLNKATLKPESKPVLDEIGNLLTQWPALKVEIGGHTDNTGTAAGNEKLSDARAKSVLEYLLKNFPKLVAANFTTKGYGQSQPVAPNDTAANRAKNRRVEFKALNAEELQK